MSLDQRTDLPPPSLEAGLFRGTGVVCGLSVAQKISAYGFEKTQQNLGHITNTELLQGRTGHRHQVVKLGPLISIKWRSSHRQTCSMADVEFHERIH